MTEEIHKVYPPGELRDPSLPPEHIGQVPAGHKRDEEERRRKDDLEERLEKATNLGEGDETSRIDPAKYNQQDNEILRHVKQTPPEDFSEFEGGPGSTGSCPVTFPVAGYVYLWVPQWDHGGSDRAIAHLHVVRQTLTQVGWERVEGTMPECPDLKAIGGVRRWGDCVLYRIKQEMYDKGVRYRQYLLARQNENDPFFMNAWLSNYAGKYGDLAHSDPRDPMVHYAAMRAGGNMHQVMEQREIRTGRVVPGRWR